MTAEPKMEDLLASIRRAIHDDIGEMTLPVGQSRGAVFKGEMRELRIKSGEASAASSREEAEPPRLGDFRQPQLLRPSFAEADWDSGVSAPAMLSAEAEVATGTAFNKLAHTLNRPGGDGQPIQDLTRELLRGMLKTWLDANLPALVERLVREEIERVARRR